MAENHCVFVDQIGPNGKPYIGIGTRAAHLERYRSRWEKIVKKMAVGEPPL